MDKDTVPAGKFKTHCLSLLDEVNAGRSLIVTKHGKPVAKVMPVKPVKNAKGSRFGCMKGSVLFQGDILSPMTDVWNLPE